MNEIPFHFQPYDHDEPTQASPFSAIEDLYFALGWPLEAHIYFYGSDNLFTVEFHGKARPTPRANVLAFAVQAQAQGIRLIINMSHRGRNATDLELHEELAHRGIPHQIIE